MSTSDYKMEIDNPTKEKTIKTAVNDISTDLASVSKDVQSLSDQLPALVATRADINWFKNQFIQRSDRKIQHKISHRCRYNREGSNGPCRSGKTERKPYQHA